ncbi:telomere-associated protein RIF1 isoform X1 [Leopardus geoffroyi]|uniref:telomere-associated protein RIF1 isoform X1 n=1 Tax=Leopardus geoffroyi TaxID=46844 RepID=UPI001E25DD14|nr:telomere-associated protein RIF1 isoform X1 [Leopardus geoffroyi]XP_045335738.1 telomere-associated protein RIF1 isoform X1 [Leopardus geoffroyi]XP_045335739.1 telomere-associated protein RIF1 isoform X1 [Leopardus geoffroyi]
MTAPGASPLEPLLETLEDPSAPLGEQTDAYLTLTSRMTGEDGKEVIMEIERKLSRLFRVLKIHISSQNSDLSSAALQALGFCLYNPKITSGLSDTDIEELLLKLNDSVKSSDKNVRTRALWVISKQTFSTEIIGKVVSTIIDSLEIVFNRGELHSAVVDYEALNVIIRLIEQAPVQMGEESIRWAKLVIPLVVHSAQKVHLRGATALEMGMPLLLQKQQEIASITEQLMTTKLLSELQKLFMSKNETYVLKLWPLFVKLLGKTLHRSGSFINSLLQLEELGFRSGAPMIKKIAFIAWKSLIDNFALNPEILCSAKRLKLLMQPLSSIHVRTETLALTKLEVWWYLLMRLGPHLPANFEQVCVPLIQSTISIDSNALPQGSSSRVATSPGLNPMTPIHKGASPYGTPVTPRMNLSSNFGGMATIPSIQLLGLEMLLHFLLGPEVLSFAKQNKLVLSLEPLEHPLISSSSFFSKHASTLITAVHDSFVAVGKDASEAVVNAIWKELISLMKSIIESGNKKERPGSEVLTLLLKSLESIVKSEVFPVSKTLVLMEITIKGLPQKVLGSPAYQVANMDILNGTPALFLIQLIFNNNLLEYGVEDERFFLNLETLVGCVLSGPTSPLAFSDSVLNVINQNAKLLENKEHLWRMWSIIVTPLTELINQTNEVNQGDALEHNFSAIYGALTLPINHIFSVQKFPVATMKTLLRTWSELYRAFARCAALVATAEENLCCEELSSKIVSSLEDAGFSNLLLLDRIIHVITVMVDCIDFSPYNIKYQPKVKSPQRPSDWSKKKKEPLGKLASLFKLTVKVIYSFHTLSFKEVHSDTLLTVGNSVTSILSKVLGRISLPSMIRKIFATLSRPLALFYENSKLDEVPKVYSCMSNKLEKLLGEIITCLHFSYTGTYDSELLEQISPLLCIIFLHKNKQIRKQSAQFWNATFAKVTMLTYPEELKPILRQAKQKFLLLLPGLENVEFMEESSGPYSDGTENSQLNMKISGMERKSSGKRDSFLAQTKDAKENMKPPGQLKLESPSPKTKSEMPLEEEKSVDFVFIPSEGKEAKERILTEHQKEVLKTKRCDIPAMYNNLDVSQDTLFSQYTHEESLEVPTLTEKSKEDSKVIFKEEQMESDIVIPQDVTENCGMDEHPERGSLSNNESGSIEETSPDILSSNNDARKKALISSTKTPTECASSAENTFGVNSSSVSNVIIFGTPPQPTSRRQTFITLEKFDGSENRPFSPSPLNNMSSTVTVKNNQENMSKTDIPSKTKKREIALVKSDSEKIVHGIKRSSRKSSKGEQTGNKRSKLLMRSEQEKNTQESVDGMVALENNQPGLLNQTECMLDNNHTHLSESAVEYEDMVLKPTIENAVLLENSTVEDKTLGINLESKENTPPTVTPADQIVDEDSTIQITPSQKTLRRSSRRRSEIAELTTDSQEKENNQKKERRKEEEKALQKSPLQVKDDLLLKQKLISEQTVQENVEKGTNLHEKTFGETSTNAEIDESKRKLDLENIKSEGDGAQDIAEKSSEKPVSGRTRYQTRRASQGLLSSIENSESDSSEAKEEGSKKKRSGKWKNKSSDSVDIEDQEEKVVKQECINIENQTLDCKANSDVDRDIKSQICEQKDESSVTLEDSTVSSDLLQVSDDGSNTYEGKIKTNKCAEYSFSNPSVPESNLRTRNASKRLQKRDSVENNSVGESSKIGTSDISLLSEKSSQTLECQHKRSRRVRRSKSCECCGEKSQPQEKSLIGLKNMENYDVKVTETKKTDMQIAVPVSETSKANLYSEVKLSDEHHAVNFHLGLKEENDTVNDSLVISETEFKEDTVQNPLPSEVVNFEQETCDTNSAEATSLESQGPSNKKCKTVGPSLDDSRDNSLEYATLEINKEKPEAVLEKELTIENIASVETNACEAEAIFNPEVVEAVELDTESDQSEAGLSEQKDAKTVFEEEVMEINSERCDNSEAEAAEEPNAEETVTKEFNSGIGYSDDTTPVKVSAQAEIPEQTAVGELDEGSDESSPNSSEEMNAKMENYEETVISEVNAEADQVSETEDGDLTTKISTKLVQANTKTLTMGIDSFVFNTLEMSIEEGKVDSNKTEANIELSKSEETTLDDNQMVEGNDEILQEVHPTSEKVEETSQSLTSETAISELVTEDNNASPQKLRELDPLLLSANGSPSGMQTRCVWSPLASPSTSILKRGLKRPHEDEISSPVHKVRRVSFADPIYQAGLADDIDRRCSIVRSHSSNNSPTVKSVKTSLTQSKHNATSTKGFLSSGSRSPKFKSSKKCLITEMAKEPVPCPAESVYPALVNCVAPVDIILPQITSNIWARGLGQLIRAKNIKTIGDLSTLTASEIKTLPIRSPKVSNVKKALRVYHEQQVKSRGLEEIPVFDISEKTINGIQTKSLPSDEERLASDLIDPVALETSLPKNLMAQISALAVQLDSEDLHNYSGSQLFEMHEKLGSMANSIIKNLQSRWRSPAHENSI